MVMHLICVIMIKISLGSLFFKNYIKSWDLSYVKKYSITWKYNFLLLRDVFTHRKECKTSFYSYLFPSLLKNLNWQTPYTINFDVQPPGWFLPFLYVKLNYQIKITAGYRTLFLRIQCCRDLFYYGTAVKIFLTEFIYYVYIIANCLVIAENNRVFIYVFSFKKIILAWRELNAVNKFYVLILYV